MSPILGAPIQINLNGSFVIPREGTPYIVGQISPDIRLEHLDAFLGELKDLLLEKENLDTKDKVITGFGGVIANVANSIKALPGQKVEDFILEIECGLLPDSNKMTYSFTFKTKANTTSSKA